MLALCRIDDRLIHGQVVIGWGVPLAVQHIVLVDDGVRASEWEQEIYRAAVPAHIGLEFADRAEARQRIGDWARDPRRIFLLTGDVETMADLVRHSAGAIARVNVGAVHAGPGRRERLRYVYLSEAEGETLRRLAEAGTEVTAQDLPTTTAVPLNRLL
jgi:PTS system mannose-specific IIB component/fructoselysine and glucoselysine-specific PTS system IIB component